jgi:hypothetical protein
MKYRKANHENILELKRKYRNSNPEYVHRDNLKRKERKRVQKENLEAQLKSKAYRKQCSLYF